MNNKDIDEKIKEINELDLNNKEKGYRNLLLTIVSWFNYLKKENP